MLKAIRGRGAESSDLYKLQPKGDSMLGGRWFEIIVTLGDDVSSRLPEETRASLWKSWRCSSRHAKALRKILHDAGYYVFGSKDDFVARKKNGHVVSVSVEFPEFRNLPKGNTLNTCVQIRESGWEVDGHRLDKIDPFPLEKGEKVPVRTWYEVGPDDAPIWDIVNTWKESLFVGASG